MDIFVILNKGMQLASSVVLCKTEHTTITGEILIKANVQDQYIEFLILCICGGVLTVLFFKVSGGDFNV